MLPGSPLARRQFLMSLSKSLQLVMKHLARFANIEQHRAWLMLPVLWNVPQPATIALVTLVWSDDVYIVLGFKVNCSRVLLNTWTQCVARIWQERVQVSLNYLPAELPFADAL